jgi:hypothetical protein
VLDGAGQSDADRGEVLDRALARSDQVAHRVQHPAQHDLGPVGDGDPRVDLAQDGAVEVGEGGGRVGRADVDTHDELGGRVEREEGRRTSSGRAGAAERRDQPEPHQGVDASRDRGPREARRLGQLGAGPGPSVTEEIE